MIERLSFLAIVTLALLLVGAVIGAVGQSVYPVFPQACVCGESCLCRKDGPRPTPQPEIHGKKVIIHGSGPVGSSPPEQNE